MSKHRPLILALAGLAVIGIGLPAIGQEAPESLLPPGFGDAARRPQPSRTPSAPTVTPAGPAGLEGPAPAEGDPASSETIIVPGPTPSVSQGVGRSLDRIGILRPADGGLGDRAWGRSDGRRLVTLVRRLDTPVASRWGEIMLRRALLTRAAAPAGVSAADWAAARTGLLLRLGEADAARMMLSRIDPDRYNAGLLQVARETALATGDPAALCALTPRAARISRDRSWDYARAICAAFAGEASVSSMYLDRARGRGGRTFDHLLAEKLVGAAGNTRRTAAIDWARADGLNSWRLGMAAALALDIPDALYATAPLHYQAWRARAPMIAPEKRLGSARIAATLGIISNSALVDLYGQAHEREGDVGRETPAALLRTAYRDEDQGARVAAIRSLWQAAEGQPGGLYAAQILTARAMARITPDDSYAVDYANIIASLMSAGLDIQAARWAALVENGSPSIVDDAWALLAVGTPRAMVDISPGRIKSYGARLGPGRKIKAQMLVAALGGLGRLSRQDHADLAERFEMPARLQNGYTRALADAAARGETATVMLLVATGMQSPDWNYVPPAHLYHIVAALRRCGQEPAARMIAAEALSRL